MTSHATLPSLARHALVQITDDMSVSDALAVVRSHRVHHLPVTHGQTLVGILCSCDLHAALTSKSVSAIMKTPVVALDREASLLDAVSTMSDHHVGSVVLTDRGRACAVVTRADLLLAHPELAPLFVADSPDGCQASAG